MKDALYFSHDSNARHDPKITAMRGVYGSEGYGWYWMFIEMMREAESYKLDMQSKYAFNAYAMQMQCERIAIASFVHDCIHEFDLFQSDESHFWSESLLRRMKIKDEKSRKAQESANARWKKSESNANASESNANASKNDAYKKGNKGKVNKDIKDIGEQVGTKVPKRFIPPTPEEVTAYCVERNNLVDPEQWYDYYTSNGWKVGKNPMKDWKAAVRQWEKNNYSNGGNKKFKTKADEFNEQMTLLKKEMGGTAYAEAGATGGRKDITPDQDGISEFYLESGSYRPLD